MTARAAAKSAPTINGAPAKRTKPVDTSQQQAVHESEVARDLRLLRAILASSETSILTRAPPKRPAKPTTTKATAAARSRAVSKTAKGANSASNVPSELPPSQVERKKLATNSFNKNLKELSSIVQERQTRKRQEQNDVCLPKIDHHDATTSTVKTSFDVRLHAECACAALDVLRHVQAEDGSNEDSIYKREQGAIFLLDRIISLELKDLAHDEAVKVYDQYWKRRRAGLSKKLGKSSTRALIHEMLKIDHVFENAPSFNFACSFQNQLLRSCILYSPDSLTQDLAESVKLGAKGSPGEVIIRGHSQGWIDSAKASDNLQIVAQAILKMHSIALRAAKPFALDLLVEYVLYRLTAAKMCRRTVKVDVEVWSILERALRFSTADDSALPYNAVVKSAQALQTNISKNDLDPNLPPKLADLLIQLAEKHQDVEQAVMRLEELMKTQNGTAQAFYASHLLAIELEALNTRPRRRPSDIQSLIDGLEHEEPILLPSYLIVLTRIRKACVHTFAQANQSKDSETPEETAIECFQLLLSLYHFLTQELRLRADIEDKFRRQIELATLRTIEAILDFEGYASRALPSVYDTFVSEVQNHSDKFRTRCSSGSIEAETIRVLTTRISNVLWRAHIRVSSSSQPAGNALSLAQLSVSFLKSLHIEDLKQAALGPRLEKIAKMQIELGQMKEATKTLGSAIEHYITADALTDAVETALSKSSLKVWSDQQSLAYQLARVLRDCLSLKLKGALHRDISQYLYVDESLPPFHQAVLIEFQLSHLVRGKIDLDHASVLDVLQTTLKLAGSPRYHIWRLRTVHLFVYQVSKNKISESEARQLVVPIQHLLTDDSSSSDMFLSSFLPVTKLLVRLQLSFLDAKASPVTTSDFNLVRKLICDCASIESLENIVADMTILLSVLEAACIRLLAVGHYALAEECLHTHIHVAAIVHGRQASTTLLSRVRLAECHLQLQDLKNAEQVLNDLKNDIGFQDHDHYMAMRLSFSLVKLEVARDNMVQAQCYLGEAGTNFAQLYPTSKQLRSIQQIERDSYIAEAAFLASKIASQAGDTKQAHRYARQSAKTMISIWAALEKKFPKDLSTSIDSSVTSLTAHMSSMCLTSPSSKSNTGTLFWPYMQLYASSLVHAGSVLSHSGLYEDALHYHKQFSTNADCFHEQMNLSLALLHAKAGHPDAAQLTVAESEDLQRAKNESSEMGTMLIRAKLYLECKDVVKAAQLLGDVETSTDGIVDLVAEPVTQPVAKTAPSKRGRGKLKASTKKLNAIEETGFEQKKNDNTLAAQSSALLRQRDGQRALAWTLSAHAIDQSWIKAPTTNITRLFSTPEYLVEEMFAATKYMLQKALKKLTAESMQSLLADSAVALPSKTSHEHRKRVSLLQGGVKDTDSSPLKQTVPITEHDLSGDPDSIVWLLQAALRLCTVLLTERKQHCSTDMIYALTKMEARISLLATTMNMTFVISSTELVLRASQPIDEAYEREMMLAAAEDATRNRASLSVWPTVNGRPIQVDDTLKPEQIDELPRSWTVISITLAETQDELIVSKSIARQPPFLIRIPLRRSNEGEQTDGLSFEDVKSEITEIIHQANSSSHDSRSMGDKATRADWHNERAALDDRLRLLLQNIELIWLGGFRGIFSSYEPTDHETKQFASSLNRTLDKHLPSRQKSSASDKIDVHGHVLKLFLGLELSDDTDTDDAVMDLLYFVVDMLQFSGEQNAYDEIDWDAMLVDVLDALHAHHERRSSNSTRHTILILDKQLECIPWEALPCLISHPVSRMPSLATICRRVEAIRQQSQHNDALVIPKSDLRASYILNPSGDLTSTQSTFEPILTSSGIRHNNMLVNKAPTEAQFSDMLTGSDVLLYFGHGSGAQYIRPRTIRSLQGCAVTFLFGCSSAKMTEYGAFESTGMPRAYMLAHAPAMIGCLWDVTDREIDRVALKTLSVWGLIDKMDERVQEGLKKKSTKKGKSKNVEKHSKQQDAGRKTLVEAVRDGREACVLKYLCGAAVVMYGIPVVIE